MTTRFQDYAIDRDGLFSLGIDRDHGQPYLSIPVANQMVDYEEYYRLTANEYQRFQGDMRAAGAFADECRTQRHDDRLVLPPGSDRGTAR